MPAARGICLGALRFSRPVAPCSGCSGKWLHRNREVEAGLSLKLNPSARLTRRAGGARRERGGAESCAAALPDPRPGVGVLVSGGGVALALAAPVGRIPLNSSVSNHRLGWGWYAGEGRTRLCARPVWSRGPTAAVRRGRNVSLSPTSSPYCPRSHPRLTALTLNRFPWSQTGQNPGACSAQRNVCSHPSAGQEIIWGSLLGGRSQKLFLAAQAPSSSCCSARTRCRFSRRCRVRLPNAPNE